MDVNNGGLALIKIANNQKQILNKIPIDKLW